jgi:hypothetical protein
MLAARLFFPICWVSKLAAHSSPPFCPHFLMFPPPRNVVFSEEIRLPPHILLHPPPPGKAGRSQGHGTWAVCFLLYSERSFLSKWSDKCAVQSTGMNLGTILIGRGGSLLFQLLEPPYRQNHWSHWLRVDSCRCVLVSSKSWGFIEKPKRCQKEQGGSWT